MRFFVFAKAAPRVAENPIAEPKTRLFGVQPTFITDKVPAMHRLLSPMNAGVSAARHVLWYVRYHAAGPRHGN
jgi:hypothetical protein